MYEIVTEFARPDPALVARAARLHVGVAGSRAGPRQTVAAAVKPLRPEWRLCGAAFTIRPEVYDDLLVGEVAAKYARPGDVLVVDAAGRTDSACWGIGMSRAAAAAGCVGVVLDGACLNGALVMTQAPLPVFCRGLANRAGAAAGPGWLNGPVVCGGVIVQPGDIVLGDCDGVVVLPRGHAEDIIAAAEAYGAAAAAGRDSGEPYYVRKGSEEKLRALPGVVWRPPS